MFSICLSTLSLHNIQVLFQNKDIETFPYAYMQMEVPRHDIVIALVIVRTIECNGSLAHFV